MTGRQRLTGVPRDESGKSRRHEAEAREAYGLSLARRGRELIQDGIKPEHAADALSGFTLGKLLLRHRADERDPSAINPQQFEWGQEWARVVHRHASIMGYKLSIRTPSFTIIPSGIDCADEPDEKEILSVRRRFSDCYNSLMRACSDHGMRVRDVTYGICVENWPVASMTITDHGQLRIGLNAVGRGLS
jgi:hypothetical protein